MGREARRIEVGSRWKLERQPDWGFFTVVEKQPFGQWGGTWSDVKKGEIIPWSEESILGSLTYLGGPPSPSGPVPWKVGPAKGQRWRDLKGEYFNGDPFTLRGLWTGMGWWIVETAGHHWVPLSAFDGRLEFVDNGNVPAPSVTPPATRCACKTLSSMPEPHACLDCGLPRDGYLTTPAPRIPPQPSAPDVYADGVFTYERGEKTRYPEGTPLTALQAIQARKKPEPWVESIDPLHWIPDA